MTFIATAHFDNTAVDTGTVNKPTGTADNDLMFTLIKRIGTTDPTSVPSGWTLATTRHDTGGGSSHWLYYKLAASEGASYQWDWTGTAARTGITVVTYRGGFDTADIIDAVSNSAYATSDTTVRAAAIAAAAAGSTIIFFGCANQSSAATFTAPSAPSAFTEDVDQYDGLSRFVRTVASLVWSGSGTTGDVDATLSNTSVDKHAFMVILNPAAGVAAKPPRMQTLSRNFSGHIVARMGGHRQ